MILVKTLSVQEQIERNNFVLATPPTQQKLPKKIQAPPTQKGKRAKPLPPPRSASTRRISNATNPSSATSSSTTTPCTTSPSSPKVNTTNHPPTLKSVPPAYEHQISNTAGYQSLSSESSGAFHSINSAGIKINN